MSLAVNSYIKAKDRNNRHIAMWLFVVCAFVFAMIVVGGITRLTESGLSMVNWKPISGIIPPLNEAEWMAEFDAYKEYPEYQKVNMGMTLDEFKNIFFWEYSHRVLGRLIGIVFAVPFFFFLWRKKVKRALKPHLWTLLVLGGCQGVLGWYMVMSGLVDRPDVSHYRLTAHLGLAVIIYIYAFWIAMKLIMPVREHVPNKPVGLATTYVVLIFIQILLGGMVAGTNAGLVSDTWPLMFGQLIPDGLFANGSVLANMLDNPLTIHFEHRTFAYIVSIVALGLWWELKSDGRRSVRFAANLVVLTVLGQFALGVLTIMNMVAIPIAAAHQGGAIVTLSASLYLLNRIKAEI
ncbi:COX15/CtaA family protein [Pseudemcibacter aquimaris]|uniref:COX15/CtaA family protein n=1 Tax=Pseudemcibacter aquimaris TaxID=2857064 RepID=UPI0020129117|nr:COX15/CtaA family protein [Pseudemcibacter aquimaris]MCC3861043.1 COX15/CtaA family protein [Pseudemcibacter aquimaris]WDU59860.1 COX15/CtaA family protein [Pseudemcibacter aquimaris]